MRSTLILATALLTACTPGEEENGAAALLAGYQATLDDLAAAVDTYVAAVPAAADLAAVTDLQLAYDDEADPLIEELGHVLDDVEGCEHRGQGMAEVLDARATIQATHEVIDGLITAHADHLDVATCRDLAPTHAQEMGEQLDLLAGHADAWSGMHCAHHDDDNAPHGD